MEGPSPITCGVCTELTDERTSCCNKPLCYQCVRKMLDQKNIEDNEVDWNVVSYSHYFLPHGIKIKNVSKVVVDIPLNCCYCRKVSVYELTYQIKLEQATPAISLSQT